MEIKGFLLILLLESGYHFNQYFNHKSSYSVARWHRLAKISISIEEEIIKKLPMSEKSLSLAMSRKTTKKNREDYSYMDQIIFFVAFRDIT